MTSLADIFNKDPLALTADDYKAMVAHYRDNRDKFVPLRTDGAIKKVRKPRAKKTAEVVNE